jgi:RHH-type transcriptional regulator, rel operon repressor / antitoxin RelB
MPSATLSIRMDTAAKERLQALASSTGRSSSHLAAEAIDTYLKTQEWQIKAIRQGLESLNADGSITHQDMRAWVESWGTDSEKSPPQPRHR